MKILILFLLCFLLMSNQCTLKTKGAMNYKAKKIEIDENIPHKSMKLIDILTLQENDDVIISTINSAEIINGGSELVVVDPKSNNIVLYNYDDGSIKSLLLPEESWLKYFVSENPKPISSRIKGGLKYIHTEDYSQYRLNDDAKKATKYSPFVVKSYKDELIILAQANMFAVSDDIAENVLDNRVILFKYNNSYQIEKVVVPEVLLNSYTIPTIFEIQNDGNIIVGSSNFSFKKGKTDSLTTLAIYDSTGTYLKDLAFLPDKYTRNNLIYKERWQPLLTCINDSAFITYPRDNTIYAPEKRIRFKLKNLPYSNDTGLTYINDYFRLRNIQKSRPDRFEVANLLPMSNIFTFDSFGKFGIVILVFDKYEPMGFYYIAQEYDFDGTLISHTRINDEPENQIRNFVFDKYNGFLCLIKKSKKGWSIEKRNWL